MLAIYKRLLSFVLLSYTLQNGCHSQAIPLPRIAVIGGGIGGATTSYYLRKLFGDQVKIDLYESNQIGGRLRTITVGDKKYEAGGSIIHSRNRYMREFLNTLKLEKTGNPSSLMGLYDGNGFVFEESRFTAVTYLKLLWRYGLSIFKWNSFMNEMLDNFDKVYDFQDSGYAYSSVEGFLKNIDLSLYQVTQITTRDLLYQKGFNERFINELGLATTRVNYGQSTEMNGFAGSLGLAAAQPDLWSVKGGNYLLAEGAINISGCNLIPNEVTSVAYTNDSKYIVISRPSNIDTILKEEYDIVIIACPQTDDHKIISLQNIPPVNFPGRYHNLIATFIQGTLNSDYFSKNSDDQIDEILTVNLSIPFNSIGRNYDVSSKGSTESKVYKIFSSNVIPNELLDKLFSKRDVSKYVSWLAYPQYVVPEKLGSFKINSQLYYTSAIEFAGSAMEMSAISGRNVAILAYNEYYKITKVDVDLFTSKKTEL